MHPLVVMVFAVCLLIPSITRAGTDVTVTISHQYLEQAIVNAFNKYKEELPVALVWKAKLTRLSATGLHVHVGGTVTGGSGGEVVTVDMDVGLACGATVAGASNLCDAESHIRIDLTHLAVASVLGPVPESTRAQIEDLLRARADDISAELTCRLNDGLLWVNSQSICPRFSVTKAGTVKAALDFEDGCVNGATRTAACARGFTGSGKTWVCGNGKWALKTSQCIYIERSGGRNPL
jgi:hypothetical protein